MHDPSGVIISPDSNGDGFYDNNANCFWQLEVGEDYAIRYTFETFSVEFSKDCGKDTVWVGKAI